MRRAVAVLPLFFIDEESTSLFVCFAFFISSEDGIGQSTSRSNQSREHAQLFLAANVCRGSWIVNQMINFSPTFFEQRSHLDFTRRYAVSPWLNHVMNTRIKAILYLHHYTVLLEKSDEGFAVSVPGLPGCHSQGETEEEALANIQDAIREYVEVAKRLAGEHDFREVEI